jgi:hypothetical protein
MKNVLTKGLSPAVALIACLALVPSVSARLLDDFNDNAKTGWSDVLLGGSVVEANGLFTITTASRNAAIFTGTTKTTESFTIENGRTLEFRVDLISASQHDQSIAVLIWVPLGSNLAQLQGYGLAKGRGDFLLTKALDQYFVENTPAGLKNDNITMVLRLTGDGANVIINGRILDKDDNNRVLYEYTVTDTPGVDVLGGQESRPASYVGVAGNFALLNYKDTSQGQLDSVLVFDNVQGFDMAATVLDDFNDNTKTGWADVLNGGSVTEADQQFRLITAPVNQTIFTASRKTSQTFRIEDGGRVELSIDVISSLVDNDAFSVLAYVPNPAGVGALRAYHLAQSAEQIFAGKEYNQWWYGQATPISQSNVRLVQTYTGEGASVRVVSRIENLGVGVNDPARILFQNEFVDTEGVDVGIGSTPDSGGAYTNIDGTFLLYAFYGGPGTGSGADVIYDNALVNYAVPGALNISPSVSDIRPEDRANFLPPGTNVNFTVTDDKTLPVNNIVLFLNGVRLTNGSSGVTLGGAANNRTFTYSNLVAGVHYDANIRVTDSDGNVTTTAFTFDTFAQEPFGVTPMVTDTLVIESEDYNHSSGTYIDFELLQPLPEASTDSLFAYNRLAGMAEVDFHDTRVAAGDGENTRHRPDPVRNGQTTDFLRQKFIDAGGAASGVYDYMIRDIFGGEWLNYTKTFPVGGVYRVYLRQAQYLMPVSSVALERVTGDRTAPDQTTVPLGSFFGQVSGLEQYRNVPLTDGVGNPVTVRLSELTTLRVSQRQTGNDDSILRQNYLVFVPAADPGTLRPIVSNVSPPPGDTLNSIAPVITADIVNRDTTVQVGSIQLRFNGTTVAATVTPNVNGASVSYVLPAPLPLPNLIYTNTIIFQDSGGVSQTQHWAFTLTYTFLRASNSLPVGSLSTSGWNYRMVQTNGSTLGNSLARAEQQLAIPPTIPAEVSASGIVEVLNFNETGSAAGFIGGDSTVPGLAAGDYNNIAMEMLGYIQLTAGAHRFGVVSDDGFQLRSGSSLSDLNATVLGVRDGGTFNGTFDFVAQADGLYPARLVWYENGGGGSFELFSVDLADPNARTLLNDGSAGAVKVWVPQTIRVASAANVTGPFAFEPNAVVDTGARTITVPQSGATRFYSINAPFAHRITGISISQGNVVLTWTPE